MKRTLLALLAATLMPALAGCCCCQTHFDPMGGGYAGYGPGPCGNPCPPVMPCGDPCAPMRPPQYGCGPQQCGPRHGHHCCILEPVCCLLHHIFSCPCLCGGYGHRGGYRGYNECNPCANTCCEPNMVFGDACCSPGMQPMMTGYMGGDCNPCCGVGQTTFGPTPMPSPAVGTPHTSYNPAPPAILDARNQTYVPQRM